MLTAKLRIPRPLRRKCVRMFRVAVSGVLEGVEFLKDDIVFHKKTMELFRFMVFYGKMRRKARKGNIASCVFSGETL